MMTTMRATFAAATAALLLTITAACGGASSGVPGAGPNAASVMAPDVVSPRTYMPGSYSGTTTSNGKTLNLEIDLSATNSSFGGTMKQLKPAGKRVFVVALESTGYQLAGTAVSLGVPLCTYSMKATYDPKRATLNGSYAAINRCSGQTGTFRTKEACYFVIPTVTQAIDRPNPIGVKPC